MNLEKYKQTISFMDRETLKKELETLSRIRWISCDIRPKIFLILEVLRQE